MKIDKIKFGEYNGRDIDLYTLKNDNGVIVKIMNYGATITSIVIPDCNGKPGNIVCGFDTIEGYFSEEYKNNAPYFGNTPGRYAGRIKDGKFTVNGQAYQLAVNNGSNHLHGGIIGFDKKVWDAEIAEVKDSASVKMNLFSPHLEEGYPGNLKVSVQFTLNNNNELTIDYSGNTDHETPLTLTNHSYFNLSGFKDDIKRHTAVINAQQFLQPDATNVPVGEMTGVENSPADLRTGKLLGDSLKNYETGFEHYYVFDKPLWALDKVASFSENYSGRKLEVYTTEPGMLFYTGFYTSDNLHRETGERYGRSRGFCCETSRYPNGPNIKSAPSSNLKPGENFKSKTVFKFSW